MKLKKILTGKPFTIGTLIVFCVGTLAVSLYLRNETNPDFVPNPTTVVNLTDSWEENKSVVPSGTSISPAASGGEAAPKANEDQYPKEVQNENNNVVVDFTDPEQEKPKAPEKPATSGDAKNPKKPPEYKAEEIKPPASASIPAPGSKNEKGEIYDPVFGWIKPGKAVAEPIHNDKDPNEQVGSMD